MIIQCRQCRTKFHFDDALMQGDGVWMRCGSCQHVFFQDNPLIIKPDIDSSLTPEAVFSEDSMRTEKSAELSREDSSVSGRDEDVIRFLDNVMETKKTLEEEVNLKIEKTEGESISEKRYVAPGGGAVVHDLGEKSKKFEQKDTKSKKGSGKGWKAVVWTILVVVIIPFIIYFVVYPQYGERFIKIANKYIGTPEPVRPEVVIEQVKLQDIRQRILNNYVLGQIRVMEGTAVNQADYPISRIVIKGAIVDAYSVVLGERASHAGNILTDDELTNLPEEEILRRLSRPEGNNNSNDKIVPNGQIPFMIVFTHEPAGVIKTTVTTIGAERLL
jgi:predicted Zn finger-like uncharacterized protein